jgi:hypothetical protein
MPVLIGLPFSSNSIKPARAALFMIIWARSALSRTAPGLGLRTPSCASASADRGTDSLTAGALIKNYAPCEK